MFEEKELRWYDKIGAPRPSHAPHMSEEEIRANMRQLKPKSWRLEGNQLIGQTDVGELRQTIPTSHILTGTDEQGLPIFRKV